MARFIEEFYYGNIDLQARSTKQNKTVQKEMAVLTKTEEQLTVRFAYPLCFLDASVFVCFLV